MTQTNRTPPPSTTRLKAGVLTLPECVAQSLTVMAPAMSGAFITYLAATKAGGATPLAFAIAGLFCLLIGGVVSLFALNLPSAGSIYTYTVQGLGSFWGYLTGCIYTIGLWIAGPAVLAGSAVFLSLVMKDIGAPTIFQQWWLWFPIGLIGWFLLSYYGIALSTRTSLVFTSIGMAVLLLLAFEVIFKGGAHGNTVAAFRPAAAGVNWDGVFAGVAFGILSFTGFETSAVLAEETKDPRRNVPRAVLGAVVIGTLFYVAVTYATSIGYGVREATTQWPRSASGLSPLANRYASYLNDVVLLVVAIDAFFCGLGVNNAISRILYAMGRDGVLPKPLGKTHPVHKTPHIAILTYLTGSVVFTVLIIGLTTQHTRDALAGQTGPLAAGFYMFAEGLTIITPPIMLGYLLLSIAGIAYASRSDNRKPWFIAVSIGSLVAACIAVYGSLYYSFVALSPGAGIPTPYAVIPWLTLGVVAFAGVAGLWLKNYRRDSWRQMGTIFD
jgi:amino acid transporter